MVNLDRAVELFNEALITPNAEQDIMTREEMSKLLDEDELHLSPVVRPQQTVRVVIPSRKPLEQRTPVLPVEKPQKCSSKKKRISGICPEFNVHEDEFNMTPTVKVSVFRKGLS